MRGVKVFERGGETDIRLLLISGVAMDKPKPKPIEDGLEIISPSSGSESGELDRFLLMVVWT